MAWVSQPGRLAALGLWEDALTCRQVTSAEQHHGNHTDRRTTGSNSSERSCGNGEVHCGDISGGVK